MRTRIPVLALVLILFFPSLVASIETAPRITDREIIERLTRLEEGLNALRAEIKQLREDMNTQFGRVDAQFDRLVRIMLGILAAFAALVATTIGFAVWDRRTMIRPFESKVGGIEEEISQNRQSLEALLGALRALSQSDEKVAEVLRRFHLL
ncbi:MAG: hypothetical protein HY694_11950 [Deltaproteobacteria bacterium]|nr:hypothetical protein [Deltaproteobacteria bacterium]